MGNILSNSGSPSNMVKSVNTLLPADQTFYQGLYNNDPFVTGLTPKISPKLQADPGFQNWVGGYSNKALGDSQSYVTNTYDPQIKQYIAQQIKDTQTLAQQYANQVQTNTSPAIQQAAAAAQQAAIDAANAYSNQLINEYDPRAKQYVADAEARLNTAMTNFDVAARQFTTDSISSYDKTSKQYISQAATAAQNGAFSRSQSWVQNTYDPSIKQYIGEQNYATQTQAQQYATAAQDAALTAAKTYGDAAISAISPQIAQAASAAQNAALKEAQTYANAAINEYDPTVMAKIQKAQQDSIAAAKLYTDTVYANAQKYTDSAISAYNPVAQKMADVAQSNALQQAQQYTDSAISAFSSTAQNMADVALTNALQESQSYTQAYAQDQANVVLSNPVFSGQFSNPVNAPGVQIAGKSNWSLKQDSIGKLCVYGPQGPAGCIDQSGNLVPPTEMFARRKQKMY